MKPGERSPELGVAWWLLAGVAALVLLGERRLGKRLRAAEADRTRAEEVAAARSEMVDAQAERIRELHFELDGPLHVSDPVELEATE